MFTCFTGHFTFSTAAYSLPIIFCWVLHLTALKKLKAYVNMTTNTIQITCLQKIHSGLNLTFAQCHISRLPEVWSETHWVHVFPYSCLLDIGHDSQGMPLIPA